MGHLQNVYCDSENRPGGPKPVDYLCNDSTGATHLPGANEQTSSSVMTTSSDVLKTTGYGLLNVASHKGGAYCAASMPCALTSPGSLGRMNLPKFLGEPPPA